MKRIILLFSSCLALHSFSQEVIASQGDAYQTSNGNVSFTIGELVISTESTVSIDLTQGFHQTKWDFVGLEDHAQNLEALVYPNPVVNALTIEVSSFSEMTYALYDAQGRLVMKDQLDGIETSIDTHLLEAGMYSLTLDSMGGTNLKVFKLIKHQ